MMLLRKWWMDLTGPNGRAAIGVTLIMIGVRQLTAAIDAVTERHAATLDRAQQLLDQLDQRAADAEPVDQVAADPADEE